MDVFPNLREWNFGNEVMRRLFHGKQSLRSEEPAHPIYRQLRRHETEVAECMVRRPTATEKLMDEEKVCVDVSGL
jgi:hypothetical protein